MASSSVSDNAASMLNPRIMGSPSHHQASISPEDEYSHLPCKKPIRFHVNVVQIWRSAICVFAFVDIFLVACTNKTPITVPLVLFIIATLIFNAHHVVGSLMPGYGQLEGPFFSFRLFCMKVTCGQDDNSDDESRSLLRGFEWLNDDPKKRSEIWKAIVDITLAVVICILVFVHKNQHRGYTWWYYRGDLAACVASYVFGWLVVSFELAVVFMEVFSIFRGATVFLCPDEDVEGHAGNQIRLPPSPPVMANRGGEHISIVA
ncbi:uncharacterized protein PgNI_08668 [Pyricularia grisea]|uniref:Uncharacterized protein n=1 Tax=Pyricularia grisea TaxID=148305 RepID=A0A6P8AVE3_PYRGI|nr:uncharacterized protein PgNI_08668 [Pyricularia grisea]TLD06196.1 hypothetical protein PgNI_08668 [Pyricularia grisea]